MFSPFSRRLPWQGNRPYVMRFIAKHLATRTFQSSILSAFLSLTHLPLLVCLPAYIHYHRYEHESIRVARSDHLVARNGCCQHFYCVIIFLADHRMVRISSKQCFHDFCGNILHSELSLYIEVIKNASTNKLSI
jgi:hypothetical protein